MGGQARRHADDADAGRGHPAALEELKRKGPAYKREVSTWGQVGQGALALGCIAAAVAGQIELGIPCVVAGATSSAAMSFWNNQQ